jgi:hypothetical protein
VCFFFNGGDLSAGIRWNGVVLNSALRWQIGGADAMILGFGGFCAVGFLVFSSSPFGKWRFLAGLDDLEDVLM